MIETEHSVSQPGISGEEKELEICDRFKIAIVTLLAIFVLIVIINQFFGGFFFLTSLPMLLRGLVLTVGLVGLMT